MHLYQSCRFVRGALLIILTAVLVSGARAGDSVEVSHLDFRSGDKFIDVGRYAPAGGRGRSAVIVLHGAGGWFFDGTEMARVARQLAQAGDEAYVVHYFNRTDTMFGVDSNMQGHYPAWLETVRDSIGWVQKQRGSADPIGIYGYSLGAFLAVSAASNDPRVGTVVERSGGIWNNETKRIGRLPPMLLIHGRKDSRVPFDKYAVPLLTAVKTRSPHWETQYYPEESHVFTAAGCTRNRGQAVAFFARYLR